MAKFVAQGPKDFFLVLKARLEKVAAPVVNARTIAMEYQQLASKFPHLAKRMPVAAPPTDPKAILAGMKARLTGLTNPQVLAAQQAEQAARSGALQRQGVVKIATKGLPTFSLHKDK